MLTDGQLASTNPNAAAAAATLRKAHPNLQVHIVSTGPKNCGDDLIKQIVGGLGPQASCVDGSAKPADDTADAVLAAVPWGDRK